MNEEKMGSRTRTGLRFDVYDIYNGHSPWGESDKQKSRLDEQKIS